MGLCVSQLNALTGTTSNRELIAARRSRTRSASRHVYRSEPVRTPQVFSQDLRYKNASYTTGPCNTMSAMPSGAQSMVNHVYDSEPVVLPSSSYHSTLQNMGYQGKEVNTGISNNIIDPPTSTTKLVQPANLPKSLTAAIQSTDIPNIGLQRSAVANGGTGFVNNGNPVETSAADVVTDYQSAPIITSSISGGNGDFQINKGTGLNSQQIGYPVGTAANVGVSNFTNTAHSSALGAVNWPQNFGSQIQPNIYGGFQSRGLRKPSYPIRGIGYGARKAKGKCGLCETIDPFY